MVNYGPFTCAHTAQCFLDGDGVLACVPDTSHSADGIGMTLAHTLAPEGFIPAFRQDSLRVQAVEGEEAGIPANGNDADLGRPASRRHPRFSKCSGMRAWVSKLSTTWKWRASAGVCSGRSLGAAATENHDINAILPLGGVCERHHRYAWGGGDDIGRVAAGENGDCLPCRDSGEWRLPRRVQDFHSLRYRYEWPYCCSFPAANACRISQRLVMWLLASRLR